MANPFPRLRLVAIVEGISFLVLMGVAMPLKYVWHEPLAVQICGWIHGLLFLWFALEWQNTRIAADWGAGRAASVFVAALLPFGPFVLDRRVRQWEQEFLQRRP